MSSHNFCLFFVFLVIDIYAVVASDLVNATPSNSAEKLKDVSHLSPVVSTPVFKPAVDSAFQLNLLSPFPENVEISDYCRELLHIFGQGYEAYVNCLIPAARPVKVCQNCHSSYGNLLEIYTNISSEQTGPGNESCSVSLLSSDRLMLVYQLFSNLKGIWEKSNCAQCVSEKYDSLTNDTLYFLDVLSQTILCFDRHKQGNFTDLCTNCNTTYKHLNVLYGLKEKNLTLCIDMEDAMNMTRQMWSKTFNCSFPHEETVPVIAVSSFLLFLPIIFYLSNFLHSEQKKRKLIHPNRAKSYTSLVNIQDKRS